MDDFAVLYEDCARVGLADPRRVDDLELWEAAAILGRNRPDEDEDAPNRPGAQPRPRSRPETGLERARRLERERPDWMDEPLTPGEEAILTAGAQFGGGD